MFVSRAKTPRRFFSSKLLLELNNGLTLKHHMNFFF
jgi:hypothetical protein